MSNSDSKELYVILCTSSFLGALQLILWLFNGTAQELGIKLKPLYPW
jgi:hypothetical protein